MSGPRVNAGLSALERDVADLAADPRNVRRHDERSVRSVSESLRRFGQQKPIVVLRSGRVIAGNCTLEAARRLGFERLAVVEFDDEDEQSAVAYAIADNRTAELSDWDEESLREQVREQQQAFDLAAMDWTDLVVDEREREQRQRDEVEAELNKPEVLQFYLAMTIEQSVLVRAALRLARERTERKDIAGALAQMCREYLDRPKAAPRRRRRRSNGGG
ncbi:MAG: hypothetical protein GF393_01605 [Armatimonadia bacterium]|nr:hypothetical protein [Armatimonadia bacterium]